MKRWQYSRPTFEFRWKIDWTGVLDWTWPAQPDNREKDNDVDEKDNDIDEKDNDVDEKDNDVDEKD